ncbi:MAG: YqgE/AlgH family protein [Chloroflexi bacterium]|nr:YqgE/AlgH family protein [Chloroflexota bacterium]
MVTHPLEPGLLLVAPPAEDSDPIFGGTVVLVVDREPNGITTGLVLNRPLEEPAIDRSAVAALFVSTLYERAYWGGPLGDDPVLLAELDSRDGLEWFHLENTQLRPFPLLDVGLVALGEHPDVFAGRVRRARLFVGMCVWSGVQLGREVARGDWRLARAAVEDVFTASPETLLDAARLRVLDGL